MAHRPTFTCRSCGISVKTIKAYVDHQFLHRHDANRLYPCCFSECKRQFTKYTALKAHVYRNHNASVSQSDDPQGPFVCDNASCQKKCIDLKDLLAHIRLHLSKRELVHCPFTNCDKTFKLRSSFTAHVSRNHKHVAAMDVRVTSSEPSVASQSNVIETEAEMSHGGNEPEVIAETDMRALYMKNLCMFYMALQAKYLVPSTTIQMIVEEINGLNDICHQYTQKQFRETLRANSNLSETDIDAVFGSLQEADLHLACSSSLSTEYTRRQYFQKNFSYVHPQNILLGTDENRRERYAQYIPLGDTLRAILKDPVVWQECIKSQNRPASAGVFEDVCDGYVFKSNDLFKQPDITLKLILYQDAFEIVNPLGSAKKKHKIVGVYFTLANFEPFYRSGIDNLQLLLLCNERDFKFFGHDKLFARMLSEVRELEEHGLVTSSGHVVRATVLSIVGDNLGSHCIGGYTENFSTSLYCCRYCLVPKDKLENVTQSFPARTVENYKDAVQLLQDSEAADVNGIKFDSVFNCLKYFHVCQPGLPPCIGHDLFEGVVAYDLAIYLRHFVKVKKWFTYTQLNRRIMQFVYQGSDASSSPCQVSEKGKKIGGQAAENWCLLRLLPVIIGDKIDPQDPTWQLVISLKELVELVCAPKITTAQVAYLNVLVVEYLETRKEMFPSDKLKPKHHYLTHYPSLILKLGPLVRLWTMRFESKHSYFKRCVRRTQNFKNVCQTLANNHQLLQTYLNSSSFFAPVLKSKDSSPYHAHLYSDAVRNAVEAHMLTEPDSVSTEVRFKGTLYKKGSFLCLKHDDESVEFGQIELVLIKDNKHLCFLVTAHTSLYLSEYGLYEVKQAAGDMRCINVEQCLDFYPLSLYSLRGVKVISLKHSIVDLG